MSVLVVLPVLLVVVWEYQRRRMLAEIEKTSKKMTALHLEVASWQACHDHSVAELDRRLSGLEETTALAANEIRMASTELLAHLPSDKPPGGESAG